VGKNLPSSLWEAVRVDLVEKNGVDEVVIEEGP
jgi:pyrimidine operon attenuation protein/uracil phosphoribosyltransferase